MSLANVFRILLEGRKTAARYRRRWNACSSRPESLAGGPSPEGAASARSVGGSQSGRPLRRIQAPRTDGRGRVDVVRPAPASLPATGRGFQPRNSSEIFVRHELDPLEAVIPTVASDSRAARRTEHSNPAPTRDGCDLTGCERSLTLNNEASSTSGLYVQHGWQRPAEHRCDLIPKSEGRKVSNPWRDRNTTKFGRPFDDSVVDAVWAKARQSLLPGAARDICGATIFRQEYGQTTDHGWEIDHIHPVKLGGSDDLSNLRPLHWRNNRAKADRTDSPDNWCAVR